MTELKPAPSLIRLSPRERASFASASLGLALVNGLTTARVLRSVPEETDSGGHTDAWQTVDTLTGALRQAADGREGVEGEQVRASETWEFVTGPYPPETPAWKRVRPADRLAISETGIGESLYDVTGDDSGKTSFTPGAAGGVVLVISLTRTEGTA